MTSICETCRETYEAKASRRFCSVACKSAWMKTFSGCSSWNWRGGDELRNCRICGTSFSVKRSLINLGKGNYCSNNCRAVRRSQLHGELNSNWGGGFTRENKMLAEQRSRAAKWGAQGNVTLTDWLECKRKFKFQCPDCGQHEPEIWLTLDHIIPFSKGGQHRPDNVQPLCRHCNAVKYTKIIWFSPERVRRTIHNFMDLVTAVGEGIIPTEYIRPNQELLDSIMNESRGTTIIPGCEAYLEGSL